MSEFVRERQHLPPRSVARGTENLAAICKNYNRSCKNNCSGSSPAPATRAATTARGAAAQRSAGSRFSLARILLYIQQAVVTEDGAFATRTRRNTMSATSTSPTIDSAMNGSAAANTAEDGISTAAQMALVADTECNQPALAGQQQTVH